MTQEGMTMAKQKKTVMLELEELDQTILAELRTGLESSGSDVLRWALRWYLLNGPKWEGQAEARSRALPRGSKLRIGPYSHRRIR
jgi:hypothetical protein